MNAQAAHIADASAHAHSKRRYTPKPIPNVDELPASALLTPRQVVGVSGFSIPTLKRWAKEGKGPRVVTIEGRPRYRADDVREWLSGR